MTKLVVAIGGNALLPAGEKGDAASQMRRIEETSGRLADLVQTGHEIIVKRAKGWKMVYDKRGGWRRVVPSPQPVDVLEKDVILHLVTDGDGSVVIAAGGGGIPVIRKDGKLVGVEAVIDKDFAASILA